MQQPLGMSRFGRLAFLLLLLVAATPAAGASVSVLFVGNSLTQANDLPTVFKRFAADSPLHPQIEVRSITPGGAFLRDHWEKRVAVEVLRAQRPNFIVLQGQSLEPLLGPQSFIRYAGLFKAEADTIGVTTVLLSTWARPAGDPYYKDATSGGSPEEMQKRLNSVYASLARDLGAFLAPAGLAFERAHRDAPAIELLDGTQHPSPAGTYLAAAVLFGTVFKPSEISSVYYGGLPKETALALQHIANQVALN